MVFEEGSCVQVVVGGLTLLEPFILSKTDPKRFSGGLVVVSFRRALS